jgi:hypothetical protein
VCGIGISKQQGTILGRMKNIRRRGLEKSISSGFWDFLGGLSEVELLLGDGTQY